MIVIGIGLSTSIVISIVIGVIIVVSIGIFIALVIPFFASRLDYIIIVIGLIFPAVIFGMFGIVITFVYCKVKKMLFFYLLYRGSQYIDNILLSSPGKHQGSCQ